MAKRQKNRQHNGQKTEEQTTQWPKDRRTDNTMAKRQKDRQHNGQKTEAQTTQWPKDRRTKEKTQRSIKHYTQN
jgi:lysozyme family protein